MLEAKEIVIDEMKFQLNPLKGFKALKLDKKIVSILMPMIKGIDSLDSDIDFGKAISGLAEALESMKDDDYEKFILDLLSTTIYTPAGKVPEVLGQTAIDNYFQGCATTLYQLMFEVMKYNKFTPFELVSRVGTGTLKTLISEKLTGATES